MSVPFPTPEGPTTTSGRGMALDRALTRPFLPHLRRDRGRVDARVRVLSPRDGASPRPPTRARAHASILVGALQTFRAQHTNERVINRQSSRVFVVVGLDRAGDARVAMRTSSLSSVLSSMRVGGRRNMHQSLRRRSKSTAEESARAGEGGSTSFEGVRVSISMRISQNEDNNNDHRPSAMRSRVLAMLVSTTSSRLFGTGASPLNE